MYDTALSQQNAKV